MINSHTKDMYELAIHSGFRCDAVSRFSRLLRFAKYGETRQDETRRNQTPLFSKVTVHISHSIHKCRHPLHSHRYMRTNFHAYHKVSAVIPSSFIRPLINTTQHNLSTPITLSTLEPISHLPISKTEREQTTTMPSTQPSATTHPQARRGAISVPQGQALGEYTMHQQESQAQAQARLRNPTTREANTQPEQQAEAGAEAPEGYRA
jgi:hypothetical protein